MSHHLHMLFHLLPLQDPPPVDGGGGGLIDSGPRSLPGKLGQDAATIIGTAKTVLLIIAVLFGLIGTGLIMTGSKNRTGYAVSGIEKVGFVVFGLAVMGSLPAILSLVL